MLTKAIYTFRKAIFIQLVSHTIEKEELMCFTLIKVAILQYKNTPLQVKAHQ